MRAKCVTDLRLEGNSYRDDELIARMKMGAVEAHRQGAIPRHAPVVEVIGNDLIVDACRPSHTQHPGAVDHELIVGFPTGGHRVMNPVPGSCHVSDAGARQLDALGRRSMR